jgi:hypothetical protein
VRTAPAGDHKMYVDQLCQDKETAPARAAFAQILSFGDAGREISATS